MDEKKMAAEPVSEEQVKAEKTATDEEMENVSGGALAFKAPNDARYRF